MKFGIRPTSWTAPIRNPAQAGFTLAEVLAALLFMAIVIPVAMQGLRIASLAGVVAQRKADAARVAERVLNESLLITNWNRSVETGLVEEGTKQYRWTLRTETWNQNLTNTLAMSPGTGLSSLGLGTMNLLTVEVLYSVQNQDYAVRLSTLASSQ